MSDPQRGDFEVNARTLIITAGALVALAAPTVANARMLPGGALTGVWITLTPSLRNTSSKAALNLLSRSWIRNLRGAKTTFTPADHTDFQAEPEFWHPTGRVSSWTLVDEAIGVAGGVSP